MKEAEDTIDALVDAFDNFHLIEDDWNVVESMLNESFPKDSNVSTSNLASLFMCGKSNQFVIGDEHLDNIAGGGSSEDEGGEGGQGHHGNKTVFQGCDRVHFST